MGLFDYLTPPVARAVLARLLDLLAPGGALVVGNFHVANRSRVYMDYWMDWPLYYRSEADLPRARGRARRRGRASPSIRPAARCSCGSTVPT